MGGRVTSADVRRLVRRIFDDNSRYIVADEVSNATGAQATRRIDMIVFGCYPSDGYRVEGIEIKVDAADLRRELENIQKHGAFFDDLTHFSLAAPASIINMDIIPAKWGVYEVRDRDDELSIRRRRRPLALRDADEDDGRMGRGFAASLIRRAARADGAGRAEIEAVRREAYEAGAKSGRSSMEFEIRRLREKVEEQGEDLKGFRERWGIGDYGSPELLDEMKSRIEAVMGLPGKYEMYRIDRAIELLESLRTALGTVYSKE